MGVSETGGAWSTARIDSRMKRGRRSRACRIRRPPCQPWRRAFRDDGGVGHVSLRGLGTLIVIPTSEQVDAYRNADYVVFADREFVLRIGEPSAVLDELIRNEGATTAAFITAANPRGDPRSTEENGVANAPLQNFVATAGHAHSRA